MSAALFNAVFDCNVFLQALGNPAGPAGRCVSLALEKKVQLYLSSVVLAEIREVTSRPRLIAKFRLRPDRVEVLLLNLLKTAVVLQNIPDVWIYPRDVDDAHYVNLAIAAGARLIVSRDKDLLELMNDTNTDGRVLRARFPDFLVCTPPDFVALVARASS